MPAASGAAPLRRRRASRAACRVWDIRTKVQVHCLSGHEDTVAAILAMPTDPQVVTGSHDKTVRLWDLRMGKTLATLTHHKKVRAGRPGCWRSPKRVACAPLPRHGLAARRSLAAAPTAVTLAGGAGADVIAHGAHVCLWRGGQRQEVQAAPGRLPAQLLATAAGAPRVAGHRASHRAGLARRHMPSRSVPVFGCRQS